MPILGAHMSIAGGYHRAVERAKEYGCECVQMFTKNNTQWRAKEITPDAAGQFQRALAELGIRHPIGHDSYLINLASPDETLWRRSLDSFVVELLRAEQLGLESLVTHPGACGSLSAEAGLARVIAALDEIQVQTPGIRVRTLLENTAGQGSALGWRFEHLATILDGVRDPDRLGVCLDTCHLFAAGYPLGSLRDFRRTINSFDTVVGVGQIRAFHVNDSKRERGSRVDRHAKIGSGRLGLSAFRHLLNDPRFSQVPMYLETPKGLLDGVELDVINLATLRGLVKP